MEDKTRVLIACIAFSVLGIASITAIDYKENTKIANISEISSKMAGDNVIICGIVKSKSVSTSGTTFMAIADKDSDADVRLVFFKNEMNEAENTTRGRDFCAKGTVQIYNGTTELIGKKMISTQLS